MQGSLACAALALAIGICAVRKGCLCSRRGPNGSVSVECMGNGAANRAQAEFRRGIDETLMDSDCSLDTGTAAGRGCANTAGAHQQRGRRELTGIYGRREPEVPDTVSRVGLCHRSEEHTSE